MKPDDIPLSLGSHRCAKAWRGVHPLYCAASMAPVGAVPSRLVGIGALSAAAQKISVFCLLSEFKLFF